MAHRHRIYDEFHGSAAHEHAWLFGSGGDVSCAIGDGRFLYNAVNRESVTKGLSLIRKEKGEEATRLWLERLLDPEAYQIAAVSYNIIESYQNGEDFDHAYNDAESVFESSLER